MQHPISRQSGLLLNLLVGLEQLPIHRCAPWLRRWLYAVRRRLYPHDILTGLYHHRAFSQRLQEALLAGKAGALLWADIDFLAWVNHSFGHFEGDKCLQHFAGLWSDTASGRLVGRLGGDKFVMYTEQASEAESLAEQFRARVEQDEPLNQLRMRVSEGHAQGAPVHVPGPLLTVSIGVGYARAATSFDELVQAAEKCAWKAKASGRNRVVAERPDHV